MKKEDTNHMWNVRVAEAAVGLSSQKVTVES